MTEKRTSIFENGLIWFGAGVSLAEILTGTYFAPLGFQKGLLAIIIGHLIGCTMLFLAGVIGGKTRRSAMETVKMSFGEKGGIFFSFLNVLQLVGWTAIMIYDGALAADGVLHTGSWVWCLVIGALIVLWIFIGITNLGKINTIAMAALFILTLVLCKLIFFDGRHSTCHWRRGNVLWRCCRAVCSNAAVLAAAYQRLHKGSKGTCEGYRSECDYLWPGKLLDVCDRYGCSDLYRRV